MSSKHMLALLGLLGLGVTGWLVYYYRVEGPKIAAHYRESDASWEIEGVCTEAGTGGPVPGAQVTVFFTEPKQRKHYGRSLAPLATTSVVVNTDHQGRFKVQGHGGSAYVMVRAEGYWDPEPWENWRCYTRNGLTQVQTNLVLTLKRKHRSGLNLPK